VTAELLKNDMRRIKIEKKKLEEKRDALKAMVKIQKLTKNPIFKFFLFEKSLSFFFFKNFQVFFLKK